MRRWRFFLISVGEGFRKRPQPFSGLFKACKSGAKANPFFFCVFPSLMRRQIAIVIALALMGAACGGGDNSAQAPVVLAECPPTPPAMSPHAVMEAPIRQGPFASHVNESWARGEEIIEVRWLPVTPIFGYHEVLIYTDSDGVQHLIAAAPRNGVSLILNFGSIVMTIGAFDPEKRNLSERSRRKVVARGADLSALWADLRNVAEMIETIGVDYDFLSANSNAAIGTVLIYAGLPQPDPGLFGDFSAHVNLMKEAIENGELRCELSEERG